jgi:integrase
MPRPATGQIIETQTNGGTTYTLRLTLANGKRPRVRLGSSDEGWNRQKAEAELANVLADLRRGTWRPYEPTKAKAREVPDFHRFASEWLARRQPELAAKTVKDYSWALIYHLLPFFAGHRLDEITVEEVDRYKAAMRREGQLAPNQINKTLTRLAQVLEDAVEYGYIDRNPARGRRRRVKGTKPARPTIEPEQLPSLLDAAGHLRPIVAVMAGGGLRNGEACALDWPAVRLGTGTLVVQEAKTETGQGREVDLALGGREELTAHKARSEGPGPVFRNGRGRRHTVENIDRRFKTAVKRANVKLRELGIEPISETATPHSLRRLYASLRFALGDDPVYVAAQLGHTEAIFSMKVYARAVKRRERLSGAHLAEFDRACDWADLGRKAGSEPLSTKQVGKEEAPDTASASPNGEHPRQDSNLRPAA